mgnify:CR=1 FL=1
MEFKGTKMLSYESEKSSSPVFKENHIKDYLSGYNQAFKDSKAPEMLEMLIDLVEQENLSQSAHDEVYNLIKQATEL